LSEGRGTSMLDGLSIAWSVIEHLHSSIKCRTLASTHYHQLAKLGHTLPRVDCYHVTAKHSKDGLSFTFKVTVSKRCNTTSLFLNYGIELFWSNWKHKISRLLRKRVGIETNIHLVAGRRILIQHRVLNVFPVVTEFQYKIHKRVLNCTFHLVLHPLCLFVVFLT